MAEIRPALNFALVCTQCLSSLRVGGSCYQAGFSGLMGGGQSWVLCFYVSIYFEFYQFLLVWNFVVTGIRFVQIL